MAPTNASVDRAATLQQAHAWAQRGFPEGPRMQRHLAALAAHLPSGAPVLIQALEQRIDLMAHLVEEAAQNVVEYHTWLHGLLLPQVATAAEPVLTALWAHPQCADFLCVEDPSLPPYLHWWIQQTAPVKARACDPGLLTHRAHQLLAGGLDLDARDRFDGSNALHAAARHRHPFFITWLLRQGLRPDAWSDDGQQPLHDLFDVPFSRSPFLQAQMERCAALLIEAGAPVDEVNGIPRTPAEIAQTRGWSRVYARACTVGVAELRAERLSRAMTLSESPLARPRPRL